MSPDISVLGSFLLILSQTSFAITNRIKRFHLIAFKMLNDRTASLTNDCPHPGPLRHHLAVGSVNSYFSN